MGENLSLSFQGIWQHKLRSFLTMLGIIIGIAAIITIVSTIRGTNEQIKQNLIGSGNNVVTVSLTQGGSEYEMDDSLPSGVSVITESTRRNLEMLDGVKAVSLYRSRSNAYGKIYYGNEGFTGTVLGIDSHYLSVNDYVVSSGRDFTDSDRTNLHRCCLVDDTAAASLLGGDAVGKVIEIGSEPFVVVGIVEKRTSTELAINSYADYENYGSETTSGTVMVPTEVWPVIYRFDEPQTAAVQAESTDDMTIAGQNVAKALTALQIGDNDDKLAYSADDVLKNASDMQALANSTNTQLLWIAGISLLVGGIGVMNIMLVSVTERTREIGLKKALGAKKKRIAAQFLTEAAVLTSLGGILGVISGIVLSRVVSNVLGTPSSISIVSCVIAVAFSMGIGIVAGILPAMNAAKLNPIDALRTE